MNHDRLSITAINRMDEAEFVKRLGWLFEGPPWIARAAWGACPFRDRSHLLDALWQVIATASQDRHIALIQSYPDLVGRAALAGTLSPASTSEQAAAGLNRLTPAEIAQFNQLNAAYQQRFGFPFVICARANKKATILDGFAQRLPHERDQEIRIAMGQIKQIMTLRLEDAVHPDAKEQP